MNVYFFLNTTMSYTELLFTQEMKNIPRVGDLIAHAKDGKNLHHSIVSVQWVLGTYNHVNIVLEPYE